VAIMVSYESDGQETAFAGRGLPSISLYDSNPEEYGQPPKNEMKFGMKPVWTGTA